MSREENKQDITKKPISLLSLQAPFSKLSITENLTVHGDLIINGVIYKSSGTFDIPHPFVPCSRLLHYFTECPHPELFYSGQVRLDDDGCAIVNIDKVSHMSDGTFCSLCTNIKYFCIDNEGITLLDARLDNNLLIIQAREKQQAAHARVFWQVMGQRQDDTIMKSSLVDSNGQFKVEE